MGIIEKKMETTNYVAYVRGSLYYSQRLFSRYGLSIMWVGPLTHAPRLFLQLCLNIILCYLEGFLSYCGLSSIRPARLFS